MIFAHIFDFVDEPTLNTNSISSSKIVENSSNKIIEVLETDKKSVLKNFSFSSEWIDLSGQQARYHNSLPMSQADKSYSWAMEIEDVLILRWSAIENKIYFAKEKNYSSERLQFWVYHTFFPFVLELMQKYHILHVGSVEVDGKPIVFSAFSFGGKSTMTDYFIQKGHTLLSDDTLAIEQQGNDYYAIASYPFHRPYREPESLGYHVTNFAMTPKPLNAFYMLEKSEADAEVKIVEVNGIEKFKAFHYSTFINFSFMKKRRFKFFTEMAKHIPVYRVTVPWDMDRLDEVYMTITKHCKSV
jgi:hypothetical protein